ncbi:MAG: 4Fe-4S binding protein [Acidobacteria bacterium]|nr:MAG: 4Fe-4S binding protein [Acidobacteriota bacterium]REK08384.1 MAG: 4Fe-4S binding protein [Acidobacteriota bacterium]
MASLDILQPAPPGGKIRPSKNSRRRLIVLAVVHLIAAAHITHWLVSGRSVTPVEPSEAIAFSRDGIVNAGLIFFAVTALLTAVFGRFFCGWACHLVALQDVSRSLLERVGIKPRPLRSRVLVWIPAIAFLHMFVAPAVVRLWRERSLGVHHYEWTTSHFWQTFPGWFVAGLTFFVCGFVAIYLLGAKGFCTYACPYGALYGFAERFSPLRIRVNDDCEQCGHCTAVCTSNVLVHQEVRDFGMVVDPGCMKCLDCVSVCPKDALRYGPGRLPFGLEHPEGAPGRKHLPWREEIVLGVGFVIGYGAFRSLHGWVPFLLSLGLGACVGFFVLLVDRLLRREHLSFNGRVLKQGGNLAMPGKIVVASALLLCGAVAYSAWAQLQYRSMNRAFAELYPTARATLPLGASIPTLSAEGVEAARRALLRAETLERFGVIQSLGAASVAAWSHLLLGERQQAEAEARLAIERRERPNEMHHLLARLAVEQGDRSRAKLLLAEITQADPGDPHGWLNLAGVEAEAGELGAARSTLLDALTALGERSDLLHSLAVVEARRSESDAAVALLQRSLELDPAHRPSLETLAGLRAAGGELAAARDLFSRALALAPSDPETLFLAARVDLALGLRAEAEAKLGELVRIAPQAGPSARRLLESSP